MSLENEMRGRIARYADRNDDWGVFGLETKLDPKFAAANAATSARPGRLIMLSPTRWNP